MAERKVIAEAWLATDEAKSGTLDVIVHIGGNALPEVLELGHHAVASGAKGIAMFPPTYYRPESVDHLVDLVVQVAREFPKTPFLYYHFPKMNAFNYGCFELLRRARDLSPNVVGAKFSDSNMEELKQCCDIGLNMFTGLDEMLA